MQKVEQKQFSQKLTHDKSSVARDFQEGEEVYARNSQPKDQASRPYYQIDRTSVSRSATGRWFYDKTTFRSNS